MTARRAAAFLLAAGLLVPVAACSSEESKLDSEVQEDGDKVDQDMGSELDEDGDMSEGEKEESGSTGSGSSSGTADTE